MRWRERKDRRNEGGECYKLSDGNDGHELVMLKSSDELMAEMKAKYNGALPVYVVAEKAKDP